MRALKTVRLRLRSLLRGSRVEAELGEELRDHLEREVERRVAAGEPEHAARAAARRAFGNVPLIQEQARDARRVGWVEDLARDVVYGVRSMRRAPAYTLAALLSLALGIGANTAVFSLMDHVVVKTLPVADPQALFFIDTSEGKSGSSAPPYPGYELMRDHNRVLASIAAFSETRFKVTIDGRAEEVRGQYASGSYYDLLGVGAVHGRMMTPSDDVVFERGGRDGAVAVISHAFWRRRFDADPRVLGRAILVGTHPVTIVGVTPPGFTGLSVGSPVDITVPMMLAGRRLQSRTLWWFQAVGRLKPDVSVEQGRTDLEALWDRYMLEEGRRRDQRGYFSGVALVPAARGLDGLRREFSQPLAILMGIVVIVLLIGCTNVANLLVARASARANEIAVRLSLGASRARVVRQLLTEGALLVSLGTVAGLAFARWGLSVLSGVLAPGGQGILLTPVFDGRVLLFTAAVAAVSTILFSLAPALHATKVDAAKPSATGATVPPSPRALRQSLVVAQVALSVTLVCGAALFARSLRNILDVDAGFRRDGVLTMQLAATLPPVTAAPRTPERRLVHAERGRLWMEVAARVRAQPGVVSAGVATLSPLTGRDRGVLIRRSGSPLSDEDRYIHINQVTAGFMEAMGIGVLAGRAITDRDVGTAPRVAVLNESAAMMYFGGAADALGRPIMFPGQAVEDPYEVVGVVRDTRYESLRTPDERMAYLPIEQSLEPIGDAMIVVRGEGDVRRLIQPVSAAARRAVPEGFVTRVGTMEERLDASLVRERLLSLLAGFFGGLALVLAWIGLYGVMAYSVVRRTREIATHVAIGAPATSVVWMVVRETASLVAVGAGLGAVAALAGERYVRGQLFEVAPADAVSVGVAILLLAIVALAAACVPARRAAGIDPVIALRME